MAFKGKDPDSEWFEGTLTTRAGKAKGRYGNSWNIIRNGEKENIDFDRDVSAVKVLQNNTNQPVTDEVITSEVYICQIEDETSKAKLEELHNWSSQHVYDMVRDLG